MPYAELDVDIEAKDYARRLLAEEESDTYAARCTDDTFNRAAVLALAAFRLMNAGGSGDRMRRAVRSWCPRFCGRPPRSTSGHCGKSCPTS